MKDIFNNLWGYTAAGFVWIFDHWSGLAALTLFVLQAVYQVYRIKKAKQECSKED